MRKIISIVTPLFNEEKNLLILYNSITAIFKNVNYDYEIIFIDDGSSDNSWNIVQDIHLKDNNIKGIKFSRNFGHQIAIKAGIDACRGNAVIIIDSDLQHPPSLIPQMIQKWSEGYKVVNALRSDTMGVSRIKKFSSTFYYKVLNLLSDIMIEQGTSDFRLIDEEIAHIIKNTNENQLFVRGFIKWLGFKSYNIFYLAEERKYGNSKYSFSKMLRLALNGIMSFSIRPLRISFYTGIAVSVLSFIYIIYTLYIYFIENIAVQGWTSIIIAILFLSGVQLISVGLLGEYIGRLFIESKKRPLYLIEDKCG